MISPARLSALPLTLLLLGVLAPVLGHAQTAVVNLSFENSDDHLANTGSAGTTFGYAQGSLTFATGVHGGTAAVFDGATSLQASDTPVGSALTVAFWMNTSTTGPNAGEPQWYFGAGLVDGELGGEDLDWGVSLVGDKIAFGIGTPDTTIFSTSNVTTGSWVFVAATWDATGEMKLYINGTEEASTTGAGTDDRRMDNPFFVGQDLNDTFYTGSLDEIQIYDSALSSGQIAALAAIPEPSACAAILGVGALGLAAWRRRRAA